MQKKKQFDGFLPTAKPDQRQASFNSINLSSPLKGMSRNQVDGLPLALRTVQQMNAARSVVEVIGQVGATQISVFFEHSELIKEERLKCN